MTVERGAEAAGAGADELSYADALSELERILDSLEADRVDVDTLGARVERAAALIRSCRSRLGAARAQVESVVGELGDGAGDDQG